MTTPIEACPIDNKLRNDLSTAIEDKSVLKEDALFAVFLLKCYDWKKSYTTKQRVLVRRILQDAKSQPARVVFNLGGYVPVYLSDDLNIPALARGLASAGMQIENRIDTDGATRLCVTLIRETDAEAAEE